TSTLPWPRRLRSVKLEPSWRASANEGTGVPEPITLIARASLAQAQVFDQRPVALEVGALQIGEKPPPAPDQHQQAAAGMMVLGLLAQVLGEVVDALGEQRDLDLRRAGVLLAGAEARGELALSLARYGRHRRGR